MAANESSLDDDKKPGKFLGLIRKHQPVIKEEAIKIQVIPSEIRVPTHPPPYEELAPTKEDRSIEHHPPKKRSADLKWYGRKRLVSKIRSGWRQVYQGLGLRHWAFVGVIIAYAFAGGAVFSWLERDHFKKERQFEIENLAEERRNLSKWITSILYNHDWAEFFLLMNDNRSIDNLTQTISVLYNTNWAQSRLDTILKEYQESKNLPKKTSLTWDIWDGVFYSVTIFTTIGYGHFAPETKAGRVATMIYALIGIPLVLAVLADFGKLLTRILKRCYSFIRHAVIHLRRLTEYKRMKARGEDVCISFNETQEDAAQFDFPIPLAVSMVVVWLVGCAAVYNVWETKWEYYEAFYFFFVSLSTIGLGDLVPEHPKYMLASFPAILIGLTLISLVVNLIQNKIDQLRERAQEMLEDQFGLDTVSASESGEDETTEPKPSASDHEPEKVEPLPVSSSVTPKPGSKAKFDGVALGVLQSVHLRAKRRRIGTQTPDSYVRDVLRRGQFSADAPHSSLVSTPVQCSPPLIDDQTPDELLDWVTPRLPRKQDTISISTESVSYYDTVSTKQ